MKDNNEKNGATTNAVAAVNSVPPLPPPLPLPGVSWVKFKLTQAENNAWDAGVPKDISEEELSEANDRLNAVEAAKTNLNEIKAMEKSKQKELQQTKEEIENVQREIDTKTKNIEDLKSKFDKETASLDKLFGAFKQKLLPKIRKNQMEIFRSLSAEVKGLDSETNRLDRCNRHYDLLTSDLEAIEKTIFVTEKELSEAEKKITRLDDVKAILFKTRQESKKSGGSHNQSDKANDEENVRFEKFLAVSSEGKKIRDRIEEIEKRKFGPKVNEVSELKEKLKANEVDCQAALRSGVQAINYQLRHVMIKMKQADTPHFDTSRFFKANPSELEVADSKDAMQTSSP